MARAYDELRLLEPLALGRGAIDRAAEHRSDEAWLAAAWAAPTTRVLRVDDGRVPFDPDQTLTWERPGDVPQDADRYLLGVDPTGAAVFAVRTPLLADRPSAGVRGLAAVLDDDDAALVAHAVGLANWHAVHLCCARCGAPTVVGEAGHLRTCPADGSQHFPRTDPAVIVLVVDSDGRALLARNEGWPEDRYSTLAGFVEPGESLEQALRREVHEETGVELGEVRYAGSQPWPLPSSLMCGFFAIAATGQIRVDGHEIADALWLSRADFDERVADGRLRFPPSASIARKLMEAWYGGPLPEDPESGW